MSTVESQAVEKKIAKRNPVSKELSRTKKYVHALSKVYSRYITLCNESSYKKTDTKMSFFCHLCQGITVAKASTMLRGSGCRVCRTNAKHISELNSHKMELEFSPSWNKVLKAEGGQSEFKLKSDPVAFNRNLKYYYACCECNSQIYLRPDDIIKADCGYCAQLKERRRTLTMYRTRLNSLYLMKINQVGEFSLTHPILHSCNQHGENDFTWFASVDEMLQGAGCKRCGPVEIKTIDPISISGKSFIVRSKLEVRLVKELKKIGYKASDIQTRFEFPIPITFGKHTPSVYVREIETVYDVFKDVATFERRVKKVIASRDLLRTHGLRYRVAIVMANNKMEFRDTQELTLPKKRPMKQKQPVVPFVPMKINPNNIKVLRERNEREAALAERKKAVASRKWDAEDKKEYARLAKLIAHFDEAAWGKYVEIINRQSETSPFARRQLERIKIVQQKQEEISPPFDV